MGKGIKRSAVANSELLYGKINCHFITKTPVAVPDVNKAIGREDEHRKYPFFSINGKKLIPGSEIRGTIRSVYETITDSCLGTMNENVEITARVKGAFAPGLLFYEKNENDNENGKWKLYKAERFLVIIQDKGQNDRKYFNHPSADNIPRFTRFCNEYQCGQKVKFNVSGNGYQKNGHSIGKYVTQIGTGNKEGYISLGETAPKRHFQSIFTKGELEKEIDKKEIDKLEKILDIYNDKAINSKIKDGSHSGYKWYETAKKEAKNNKGAIPVYYQISDDNKLYLSPAALGRKIFSNTLNDIVKEYDHQKCDTRNNLCPACALFGTTVGEGLGSRVRFSDCTLEGEFSNNGEWPIFPELGSPRPSYMPFYLSESSDYSNGYDGNSISIKGRKFYWHHTAQIIDKRDKKNITERNGTFEVMKENSKGFFSIYFDGINEAQLQQLCTSIHFNENNEDGILCHKIGHGKPVGYGSIKVVVDSITTRKFDVKAGWSEVILDKDYSDESGFTCTSDTKKALLKIVDFNTCNNKDVRYPYVILASSEKGHEGTLKDNVLASHKWFSTNYKLGDKKGKKPLPSITADCIEMEVVEVTAIDEKKDIDKKKTNGRRSESNKQKQSNNNKEVPKCACPNCNNEVKINNKNGKYFKYCWKHKDYK